MTDDWYRGIVSAFKEHILAGDIYQGVPSRRVSFPAADGGYPIYRRLRVSNPAPYMFFLRMLSMELAGSSPEPLVRVEGRRASTRPIAGTRPRGATDVREASVRVHLVLPRSFNDAQQIWPATTSVVCARREPCGRPSSWWWSASPRSCTS